MPDRVELLTQLRTTDEFSVLGKKVTVLKTYYTTKTVSVLSGIKGEIKF